MPVGDSGGPLDLTLVVYDAADGGEVARLALGSLAVAASSGARPLAGVGGGAQPRRRHRWAATLLAAGPRAA